MFLPSLNFQTSVGGPISRTLAKVVDAESNRALGAYQQGEVLVAGPQVMKGYWQNEKATADMIDSEGWLRTGDVGYYDDEGHFFIVDRIKELIKVKGFLVRCSTYCLLVQSNL